MEDREMLNFIDDVFVNMPTDWLNLTTHRLDVYDEKLAKTQFLDQFEALYKVKNSEASALKELRTAYDYIRLGHPLSCVLEWTIAQLNGLEAENVVSFSSKITPILAVLRKNLLTNKNTQIFFTEDISSFFDAELIKNIYGYQFELIKIKSVDEIPSNSDTHIFISEAGKFGTKVKSPNIDFSLRIHQSLGSVLLVNCEDAENYISEIQHVRRRETIAMTPANCLLALGQLTGKPLNHSEVSDATANKNQVLQSIKSIAGTDIEALVASSGLSMQYAIVMGLVHDAAEKHKAKAIKIVVPTNCYGGTNDQARRVAACIENVEVVDLAVDGGHDMVESLERILHDIAIGDAIPYIIAEIPTNPRVEVPDLIKLEEVLSKARTTASGAPAIEPVFILDQTFCPNVHFLGENDTLSSVRTIAYISGSKFPSGGKCTAGYCVSNRKAESLMEKIELHLHACDNEATELQLEVLALQLPSMLQRIRDAYLNTRDFVTFIQEKLPAAKINFVSEELAKDGFTPSVFSLDLPSKGDTPEEREAYKRDLNLELINLMITKIPDESKYCVSYGQLKGCYWTIPATSTQGTTKESDKDYIARVALSPNMDLELHKEVFSEFIEGI